MLAGSHRNAWPDETGTGGRTNRNTQQSVFFNSRTSKELGQRTEIRVRTLIENTTPFTF